MFVIRQIPYLFVFGEEKHMLHYSIHCEFGEACAANTRP